MIETDEVAALKARIASLVEKVNNGTITDEEQLDLSALGQTLSYELMLS